jgi:hypothetical protein
MGPTNWHDMEKSKKGLVILDALTFPCNVYDDTLKRISCFRGFSLVLLLRASFCPILDPMREAAKNG